MKQADALAVLNAGANVFITGAPGAGKTYVLNQFIAHARAAGANVAVTASTGIASTHINGQTIHSWSGVGVSTALTQNLLKQIRSRRKRKIEATDILVIDEVSMLHAWLLTWSIRSAGRCGIAQSLSAGCRSCSPAISSSCRQ